MEKYKRIFFFGNEWEGNVPCAAAMRNDHVMRRKTFLEGVMFKIGEGANLQTRIWLP